MTSIKDVFKFIKKSCWIDNSQDSQVQDAVDSFYDEFVKNKTKQKLLYRICGQAGSGKTSQVSFAIQQFLSHKNLNPLVISVRYFAKLHPNYKQLLKEFGNSEIREKTNGFALKCLVVALERAIKDGFLIVLDLTLLDTVFEDFLFTTLKNNNYEIEYHMLAVNKKISNQFITLRQENKGGAEGGRIIYKSSKEYFYKILSKSLKYLVKVDTINTGYIWTVLQNTPFKSGKLKDLKKDFFKCRRKKIFPKVSAEISQKEKIDYFIKNF